jgi:hypothetical protein
MTQCLIALAAVLAIKNAQAVLATTDPLAVETLRRYLAADDKSRAALLDENAAQALSNLPAPPCPIRSSHSAADPSILPSSAGGQRYVVQYPPGNGHGAHRTLYTLVGEGARRRVVDLRPLTDAAAWALADDDVAEAVKLAERALAVDSGEPEALAVLAQAAIRLSDVARAEKAWKTAAQRAPESMAWRLAAYDVAVRAGRPPDDIAVARDRCFEMVRAEQLDDGRCFFVHAVEQRGKDNQNMLRQELEEALGRNPHDTTLMAADAVVLYTMATRGKSVDRALLARAQMRSRDGLACPQRLEPPERGAAWHVLARTTLDLGAGPCAAHAELAVMSDPSVADHRRTLMACAEATVLLGNREMRRAVREKPLDLDLEARTIAAALMRDKVQVAGRSVPAYEAFTRARVRLDQKGERLEVLLLDLQRAKRPPPAEEAVRAAFMVHTVYRALYGEDAPALTAVRVQFYGETDEYMFPMPVHIKAEWHTKPPTETDVAQLTSTVVRRPVE